MKSLTFKTPKGAIGFVLVVSMMPVLMVAMLFISTGDYPYNEENALNLSVWEAHIVSIIARIVLAVSAGFYGFGFWYLMKMLRRSGYFQAMWEHSEKLKHES